MSRKQKGLIVVLALFNLIVYAGGYLFLRVPIAQSVGLPPGAAPISVAELANLVQASMPAPTELPTATPTSMPTNTPTVTSTPFPSPTATFVIVSNGWAQVSLGAIPTRKPVVVQVRPSATPVPTQRPTVAAAPPGPLVPNGSWQTLGAQSSVWYNIGAGGDHMTANLQAHPLDGMKLEVYAPNIVDRPIGVGSYNSGLDGLVWAGGHRFAYGTWSARVTNGNSTPMQYRLVVDSYEIPKCEMTGYWEYIGYDYVYWRLCK